MNTGSGGWSAVAQDLRTIALLNPRLALMLVKNQPMQPRTYDISIEFDEAASGTTRYSSFESRMFQDCWITDFVYTIRRPNAFTGNIDKWQSDHYCKLNPYVDIKLEVRGTEKYDLVNTQTPLENLCSSGPIGTREFGKKGWVIGVDQNLYVTAYLQRTLNEDEVPYIVDITLSVMEISGCNMHQLAWDEVVCSLQNLGILPSPYSHSGKAPNQMTSPERG